MQDCSSRRLSNYYHSIIWSSLLISIFSFIILCLVAGDSFDHQRQLTSLNIRVTELQENYRKLELKIGAIKPFDPTCLDCRIREVCNSVTCFNSSLDNLRQRQAEDVAMLIVQIDALKLWIDHQLAGIGSKITCLYNVVFRPCCYRRR